MVPVVVLSVSEMVILRESAQKNQGNGNGGNRVQSSSVALPDRHASRRATPGLGGLVNRPYSITSHQKKEDSPEVATSMIQVFNFDFYASLDLGASSSFVTP